MKRGRIGSARVWAVLCGGTGALLVWIAIAPVLLSGENAALIEQWRDVILGWTQFTGYLRLVFVITALAVLCGGLVGVVIQWAKPKTGQRLMLWGGGAGICLAAALWLGFLDLQLPLLGSTEIGDHLVWDGGWGIATWGVSRTILMLSGGEWLGPFLAGSALLIATNLPRVWTRLR